MQARAASIRYLLAGKFRKLASDELGDADALVAVRVHRAYSQWARYGHAPALLDPAQIEAVRSFLAS